MTVPDGLSELLEEFAVTVLRDKPKDLHEFASTYFVELNMSKKQGKKTDLSEQASTATAEVEMGGADGKLISCIVLVSNQNSPATNTFMVGDLFYTGAGLKFAKKLMED